MPTNMNTSIKTIDEYIASFPKDVQALLQKMRGIIKKAAPKATETISYGIPTFVQDGNLVHFGGFKSHIGFYPAPNGIEAFKKELSKYEGSKGTVKFVLDKPLPAALITQIVKYRIEKNKEKAALKKPVPKKSIKITKPADEQLVKAWIEKLDAVTKKEIEAVRKIIKAASPKLNERIKWNAPSYYYQEDIVTFGPYKNGKILLVFHHPSIVKIKSPLLEGNYKDRRLLYLEGSKSITTNKKELIRIIQKSVKLIDKK